MCRVIMHAIQNAEIQDDDNTITKNEQWNIYSYVSNYVDIIQYHAFCPLFYFAVIGIHLFYAFTYIINCVFGNTQHQRYVHVFKFSEYSPNMYKMRLDYVGTFVLSADFTSKYFVAILYSDKI